MIRPFDVRDYLDARGLWDDGKQAAVLERSRAHRGRGREEGRRHRAASPTAMFENMYKTIALRTS